MLSRASTIQLKKALMLSYPVIIVLSRLITKTRLYNFDPLKPHFYIVKLGFTGVCIIFLISAQNIDCGYSLEPPRRGGSNEYPQSMFWAEIWKISEFILSEYFQFLEVKFSIYLNRRVFVMWSSHSMVDLRFCRKSCGPAKISPQDSKAEYLWNMFILSQF